ncbi:MAG TPA: helix-turn-helix domain-containing protein [Tepidisphaeraceae bacterium]
MNTTSGPKQPAPKATKTPSSTSTASTGGRKYYTLEELAAVSGIAQITIRRWWEAGKIPGFQPGGPKTRILFPVDALEVGRTSAAPSAATTSALCTNSARDALADAAQPPRRRSHARWRRSAAALMAQETN